MGWGLSSPPAPISLPGKGFKGALTFSTPIVQNLWKTPENYPLAQTHKGFEVSRLESTQFGNSLIFKAALNALHSGGAGRI